MAMCAVLCDGCTVPAALCNATETALSSLSSHRLCVASRVQKYDDGTKGDARTKSEIERAGDKPLPKVRVCRSHDCHPCNVTPSGLETQMTPSEALTCDPT